MKINERNIGGMYDVDWLSNVIRTVDGNNRLGAGELAELIVEHAKAQPAVPEAVALRRADNAMRLQPEPDIASIDEIREEQEAVAKDAARYRFIRDRAVTGAVQTQLPLYRVHHWHSYEPVTEFPNLDEAIDAAILSATDTEVKNG